MVPGSNENWNVPNVIEADLLYKIQQLLLELLLRFARIADDEGCAYREIGNSGAHLRQGAVNPVYIRRALHPVKGRGVRVLEWHIQVWQDLLAARP